MSNITTLDIGDGESIHLRGDPSDDYFRNLHNYYHGSPALWYYTKLQLARDAVCVDAGANIGLTALLLAKHCKDGHVYAFEASSRNVKHLRENIELNGITNCTVCETALGSTDGEIKFHSSNFGAGSHVVSDNYALPQENANEVVPVITLDRAMAEQAAGAPIKFIKIDVEGFEPHVLVGAAEIIKRDRPAIFMEVNSWSLTIHRYDLLSFVTALWAAFDVHSVAADGALVQAGGGKAIEFLFHNMVQHHCVDDVVLTPKPGFVMPSISDFTGREAPSSSPRPRSALGRILAAARGRLPSARPGA